MTDLVALPPPSQLDGALEGVKAPAYREIFEGHVGYVFHALRRLGVAQRDLEDQVHEVFLIVHRKLASYDPSRPLRPWLLGIAYRRAADYRRLVRHRREVFVEAEEQVDPALPPDEKTAMSEARAILERALDAVDDDRRRVLVLHDFEGLEMPEIAELVGIPLRTAYSRLRVGREELTAAVHRARLKGGRP